jgi:hypothetical protein
MYFTDNKDTIKNMKGVGPPDGWFKANYHRLPAGDRLPTDVKPGGDAVMPMVEVPSDDDTDFWDSIRGMAHSSILAVMELRAEEEETSLETVEEGSGEAVAASPEHPALPEQKDAWDAWGGVASDRGAPAAALRRDLTDTRFELKQRPVALDRLVTPVRPLGVLDAPSPEDARRALEATLRAQLSRAADTPVPRGGEPVGIDGSAASLSSERPDSDARVAAERTERERAEESLHQERMARRDLNGTVANLAARLEARAGELAVARESAAERAKEINMLKLMAVKEDGLVQRAKQQLKLIKHIAGGSGSGSVRKRAALTVALPLLVWLRARFPRLTSVLLCLLVRAVCHLARALSALKRPALTAARALASTVMAELDPARPRVGQPPAPVLELSYVTSGVRGP